MFENTSDLAEVTLHEIYHEKLSKLEEKLQVTRGQFKTSRKKNFIKNPNMQYS